MNKSRESYFYIKKEGFCISKLNTRNFLLLHSCFLLYSCVGVISKFAARHRFLSWDFILLYGASLFCLLIYSVAWQQMLKRFSLTTAFANKSVTMVWGMFLGCLIFRERISWNMLLGTLIVFVGVYIVVSADE